MALVYATPFIGGIIADQILGYRKAIPGVIYTGIHDYRESVLLLHRYGL